MTLKTDMTNANEKITGLSTGYKKENLAITERIDKIFCLGAFSFYLDTTSITCTIQKYCLRQLLNGIASTATLLYRASRDGWKYADFHSRCDNKGATITLFRTDDGRVCGGFTSVSWDTSWSNKTDSKAFVFSLDRQLVFPV